MKVSFTSQEGKNAFFCHLIFVTSKKVICGVCLCRLLLGSFLVRKLFCVTQSHPYQYWHLLPKAKEPSMAKSHPTYTLKQVFLKERWNCAVVHVTLL